MSYETFVVAAIQMNCLLGDKEKNLKKAEEMVREAAGNNAKLVVVPELFNTGYRVEEKDYELAEEIPGSTTEWMIDLCKELSIYMIGCILESSTSRGRVYDTAVLTGPDGVIGTQRKKHLWDREKNRFTKGTEALKVFDLGFIRVGMQICYEIGFPEPARYLSDLGADILVYPSAFGMARNYAWDIASRSRALENGSYLIACNRAGTEKGETTFAGNSRIVSPKGEILTRATKEYEIVYSEIDVEEVVEQRIAIPYLRDFNRRTLISEGDDNDE
ncbi:carbon-nitrogen hydrolase family protein [Thalassobacillus devorans]|uniref:carbon-nitrogen hydrolase family protein n=1 Tax=Thalassobacillus devorans TaxID=279813 RepID=UPI000A1CAF99|nr:carbon-nitrogen hydrolase family protein [Thalassobacillus devorans]